MTKRKAISKKNRFEIFKRDSFRCQYCGRQAPDVILQIDHIDPVSKGGGNDLLNLITSCAPCNNGKRDIRLDDHSVLAKQRAQIEELNERREQMELMLKWRDGLREIDDAALERAREHFALVYPGFEILSDAAISKLRTHISKFGLPVVLDAMDAGVTTYCADGFDRDSVNAAFHKLGGICHNIKNPDERTLRYVRGILRNILPYVNERIAISLLRQAKSLGADDETLRQMALRASSWKHWQDDMDYLISDLQAGE